jgi:hypothetical protein
MSPPTTLRRRLLCGSIAPLLASFFAVACNSGSDGPVSSTSEAVSDPGFFHSGITRQNWHGVCGDGSHGAFDDGNGCRPKPFDLCPYFDSQFIGEDGGRSCEHVTLDTCPDRVDFWANPITIQFVIAASSDCRFGGWDALLNASDVATYLNDLIAFTLQFFGCPEEPGTTGPLTYALIPVALAGQEFTTADVDALSAEYLGAVQSALADNGSPPLTDEQAFEVSAKLSRLAHRVPNLVRSRDFNFSTCAPDAGAPAGPDNDDGLCR